MAENQLDDTIDCPIRKCSVAHVAIALVIDVSMSVDNNMQSLNNAVNGFITQIKSDDRLKDIIDLGIFVFGEKGRQPIHQGFKAISECEEVYLEATDSSTYVVNALDCAVEKLRERVILYSQGGGAHKPWLVLITDGAFHDAASLSTIGNRMKQREFENKLQFFGLGVEGYNRGQLESLTNNPNHVIEVKAANFIEFLSWVGRSMGLGFHATDTIGAKVSLPPLVFTDI